MSEASGRRPPLVHVAVDHPRIALPLDAVGLLKLTRELRQRQQVRVDRDLTPAQSQRRKAQLRDAQTLRELGYI